MAETRLCWQLLASVPLHGAGVMVEQAARQSQGALQPPCGALWDCLAAYLRGYEPVQADILPRAILCRSAESFSTIP